MPDTARPRILVVEDERIVAQDLKLNLEALGYDIAGVAASEADALKHAQSGRPDLVLMDINLGRGGDGIRAAESILREQGAPVVYLTAYAEPETLRRAGATAPYGYLLKPIELRELNATIRMALARHAAERDVQHTERRLRLALQTAGMGVVELRPAASAVAELAAAQTQALGLRGFGLPPQDFLNGLAEGVREQVRELLGRPGSNLHLITRWGQNGDAPLWLEIQAAHLEREGVVIGVFRDVSEQVQSEGQLRQAAVVFESAADAILILDREGRVLSGNPAFSALTGWAPAEVQGRSPDEFLHARRVNDRQPLSWLGDPVPLHAEVLCQRRDGTLFPAWEHLAPVRNALGALTHRVLSFSDISALRRAESRVHHLAFHDPLTGLGNRNHLDECLRAWEQQSPQHSFAVLFLDLDGFKTINDTLGHASGDQLLVTIAQRLAASLRNEDEAIRLGGDEFVILARAPHPEAAALLAGKLLEQVRLPVPMPKGELVRVSASMGIALFPLHGSDADSLIKAADSAMYAAKARGRNRYAFFTADLAALAHSRMQLEQGLRTALAHAELSLHWQPQLDMSSGALLGAEVLLRWKSAQLGAVPPDRFIPIAEEAGLIGEIGHWVLHAALRQWREWTQQGLAPGRVALNVSAVQLRDEGFAQQVRQALLEHRLAPDRLELEITESALQSVDGALERLRQLHDIGVRIALDDFGTGYSSLSMLKHLPLHRLKVDRSFVTDLALGSRDMAIVRAIVGMADSLCLGVLAEGVETEAQRQILVRLGILEAQGWLYSKALPRTEFALYLAGRRRA